MDAPIKFLSPRDCIDKMHPSRDSCSLLLRGVAVKDLYQASFEDECGRGVFSYSRFVNHVFDLVFGNKN